ncbi:MAG: hypothetical protein CMF51_02445 [Legionellales bacterium]|nr:hypothetical protein [Legionellales bacterium]
MTIFTTLCTNIITALIVQMNFFSLKYTIQIFRLLSIMFILLPMYAYAWGFKAHQAIAAMTAVQLTPKTRQSVQIIQNHQTLKFLSILPDTLRYRYPQTRSWHYITWPTGSNTPQMSPGQLYQALCLNIQKLSNPHLKLMNKTEAFSWLIHLIADAHQPLHINQYDDAGGNRCWFYWMSNSKPVSLHHIWDTLLPQMVLTRHTLEEMMPSFSTEASNTTPLQWLKESRILHSKIYGNRIGYPCRRSKYNTLQTLDALYVNQVQSIVISRMALAAQRTAYLLNMLFDPDFRSQHPQIISWPHCFWHPSTQLSHLNTL